MTWLPYDTTDSWLLNIQPYQVEEVNLTNSEDDLDQERGGSLISFDVRDLSAQVLVSDGITDVHVSMNKKIMVLDSPKKDTRLS